MALGPVQIVVVGFSEPHLRGKILDELMRLQEHDVVRLLDLLVVQKQEDGRIEVAIAGELDEDQRDEVNLAGALIGIGRYREAGAAPDAGADLGAEASGDTAEDAWYVDDTIPPGTAAAIAVLEHRWAIGLEAAIHAAGGFHLADAWVHPADLVAIGALTADETVVR